MSDSFHYLVMAEHSLLQKELPARLKGTGLTIGQPKILDYLKGHNGAGQKDIAKGCHIEPGTLTTLLNRMEEKGLVNRRMRDGNRRSLYVFLTKKGEALAEKVALAFEELEEQAFQGISKDEKALFLQIFERIYQNSLSN
nr:MarR family transcriptional regulator [uncultured Sellimonas sp.]